MFSDLMALMKCGQDERTVRHVGAFVGSFHLVFQAVTGPVPGKMSGFLSSHLGEVSKASLKVARSLRDLTYCAFRIDSVRAGVPMPY